MSQTRYPRPAGFFRCEIEVERSRFITSVALAETPAAAQKVIGRIKQEFPTANHNCWAYLCGPPGAQDQIGYSDDGEPHGCAGKPMLTALQHSGVGDLVVVVSRYFGGIKLGKGGMVKAYTQAVQTALESLPLEQKIAWRHLTIAIDYPALNGVERLLPGYEAVILERQFSEKVELQLKLPEEQLADCKKQLQDLTAGQIVVSGPD